MAKVKLSILVPTVLGREKELQELLSVIKKYCLLDVKAAIKPNSFGYTGMKADLEDVELIVLCDNKQNPIGAKREFLYKLASGEYSWQIDDDDSVPSNAIEKILAAIDATNPDCVTFRERCDMNGKIQTCNHSLKYDKWRDNWDGFDYVRTPFYKDIIKTEIARSVPFPHIRYNEDEQWSMALKPHLSTESHIDEELYYYSYYPKESHEERYGLNKS